MPEFIDMKSNIFPNYDDDEVFDDCIDKFIHNLSLSSIYKKNNFNYNDIKYSCQYISWNIKKSIKYYILAAEKNHPKAQFTLGRFYLHGKYIEKNCNKAFEYFLKAANNNFPEALYQVGRFYYIEKYNKFDFNKAILYIWKAAKQKCPEAFNHLGLIYYEGKYTPRNENKAIYFYMKAADQNISFSRIILSRLYEKGLNVSYDEVMHYFDYISKEDVYDELLFECYSKKDDENFIDQTFIPFCIQTSELNYPMSQFSLGYLYYIGYHVSKNINKAIDLFMRSAQQNYAKSFHYLGIIYSENYDIPQDIDKAIYYFKMAVRLKYPESAYYLGNIYFKGKTINKDIKNAIYYHSLASDLNYTASQYILGLIYSNIGNISESIYYFQQAANQNHIESIFSLGVIQLILHKDIKKSIHYFKIAASQNHNVSKSILEIISDLNVFTYIDIKNLIFKMIWAIYKNDIKMYIYIGSEYCFGKLLKRNLKKAIYYLSLAANQNSANAQSYLGEIYYCLKDIQKSIDYFTLAAKQKFPMAYHNLGTIYMEGNYVPRDVNLGIYYLTLAANLNFSSSIYDLGFYYYNGLYIKKDIKKAMYYFEILAKKDCPSALNYLGLIYKYHFKGKEKESLMYFHEAAIRNDVNALANLALYYLYESGLKNEKNVNKAIYYLTRASNLNDSQSQFILASIYYFGEYGIKKDIKKGINLYLLSAHNNKPESNFVVGYLYHKGENLERNIEKSIHYYIETQNKNNLFAKNNLGILYKNGFGNDVLPNLNRAIEYFTEAIRIKDDYVVNYNLIHLYFFMKPTNNSLDVSIDLLLKQSNFDFEPLTIMLCLALILKFGSNFEKIENEITKKSPKNSKKIIKSVFQLINDKELYIEFIYNQYYQKLQKMDFLFNAKYNIQLSADINTIDDHKKENMKINNISNWFYEGFGYDLIEKPK